MINIVEKNKMYAPIIRKIIDSSNVFLERALPKDGNILVSKGDLVRPFDRLGDCIFSHNVVTYPKSFKPLHPKDESHFFYQGEIVGLISKKRIPAPFNGRLQKEDSDWIFKESDGKFILLSAVWGEIQDLTASRSVLIKTQMKDILFAASTDSSLAGELVVFPNPTEILEESYLENFTKGTEGKIIYMGHYVDLELVKRAYSLGVGALIAGSAHKDAFAFAKSVGMGFAVIVGFGKYETPEYIYNLLNLVSYRHVFFHGDKNLLRIPFPSEKFIDDSTTLGNNIMTSLNVSTTTKVDKTSIVLVEVGMRVQVFQNPYFGKTGVINEVKENSVVVSIENATDRKEIMLPNFYVLG